jgi:hypothetical protein
MILLYHIILDNEPTSTVTNVLQVEQLDDLNKHSKLVHQNQMNKLQLFYVSMKLSPHEYPYNDHLIISLILNRYF